MTAPDLKLDDCSVQIDIEPHYAYPSFQIAINLKILYSTHGEIASMNALRINRKASRLHGRFLQLMDEDQQELADFSQVLFDKFGFLKKHLIENPHLRGTGAWGHEMDEGDLIYILTIAVDCTFRGRGVGSFMLQKLLSSPYVKQNDFVISWPTPLDSEPRSVEGVERKQLWTKIQESQINFFRKNNFRRIGRTQFFALSPKNDHPSRSVPMDIDAPALSAGWSGAKLLETQPEVRGLSTWDSQLQDVELRRSRNPLHLCIYELSGEPVAQKIQAAYNADPSSIHQQDDHGFTPIFAAVSAKNLHALRKLIELGVSEDLTSRDNADGLTPLEACTQRMISTREFSETLLQKWDGFSESDLLCAAAIKRAISPSSMTLTDAEYVARKKWGCTCGRCLDGWLSPRMKIRLEYEGEIKFDIIDTVEDGIGFVDHEPLSPDRSFLAPGVEYIPIHLRGQLYKTFYHGYQCAFEAVTFVSRKNVIPYPSVVHAAMLAGGFRGHDYFGSRAITFYFSKGGLPDYALDCLIDAMEEQSPLGDGEFDETFAEDLQKLPECANDFEFDLVRQNLRLGQHVRGPYREERIKEASSSGEDRESDEENDLEMD